MSVETATQIKTYFQSGDVPTQEHFANFIDSSIGPHVNVKAYGAVGDGSTDDSAAIQAAIDAAQLAGSSVFIPAGTWRIDSSLTHTVSTVGRTTQGVRIIGEGMTRTILDSRVASGAAIFLTTDTPLAYTQGAVISDLKITSTVPAADSDGISLAAQWDIKIERVWITGLTGDAITFPLMSGLSTQPDEYQCLYPDIRHCELTSCDGWGINGAAGNAVAGLRVRENLIVSNKLGGLFVAGQMPIIMGNAFQANGETSGGGVRIGYVHATPNGVIVDGNEFDSNHEFNMWFEATSGGRFNNNKLISKEISSALWPPLHVIFGVTGAGTAATSIVAYGNHHRRDAAAYDITCYKWETSSGLRCDILNPTYNLSTGASNITKYSGAASTGSEVIETGLTVTPREQPVATLNRIVAAANVTSTTANVTFTSKPGWSTNFANGVFTAPSAALYQVDYGLTLSNLGASNRVRMYISSSESGGITEHQVEYSAAGLAEQTFFTERVISLSNGATIWPKADTTNTSNIAIRVGEPYNWFNITRIS